MADGADDQGKLSKLARLKSLKSGLKASEKVSEDDSADLSLDAVLGEEEPAPAPKVTPVVDAPKAKAVDAPTPKSGEKDGESLSSYFEALGIVPDAAKVDGATGKAPTSYSAPSDIYTAAASQKEPGREVDERDLWADPVRNDDTFLTSFTAAPAADVVSEDDARALDSIIGSFDDEDDAIPAVEPEAEIGDKAVDIEAFEAEIALKDSEIEEAEQSAVADATEAEAVTADQPLTITFDESRATLLTHVSKQMSCSIDDVVVTAIDWYLDALFGEDDPDLAAQGE